MEKTKFNVSEFFRNLFSEKNTSYSETNTQVAALKFTIQKYILLLWHVSSYMNLYNGIKRIVKNKNKKQNPKKQNSIHQALGKESWKKNKTYCKIGMIHYYK